MARRSERTTGLPRSRRRRKEEPKPSRRFRLDENTLRIAILAGAAGLLVLVLFVMAAGFYHDRWGHGREVILRVDDESVTLGYFADRLLDYATTNRFSGVSPEIGLMRQLEDELLTILLARESGVDLSDAAIDAQIASDLGVPVGGTGSAFDAALRNELRISRMSLSTYRRQAEARVAEKGLLDLMREQVGTEGELVTLRVVVVSDEETAQSILERIENGEDMGTIAQLESIDLASRTQDGLRDPAPPALLQPEIASAIEGSAPGDLVGPVNIDDAEFWIVRVEERTQGEYTESQREELARKRLDDALEARRAEATIKRTADSGDLAWAAEKAVS